jgi:hypothetical protein
MTAIGDDMTQDPVHAVMFKRWLQNALFMADTFYKAMDEHVV